MAIDFLNVNRSKQAGSSAIRAANLVRDLRELIDQISDSSGHMTDGTDYTMLETNFGLETGKGANFATLIGLIQNIFNTNTDVTGANRLAQLDEFCARLAGQ